MNLRSGKTVSVRAFSGLPKTTESEWDFSAAVLVKAHIAQWLITVLGRVKLITLYHMKA